MKVRQKQCVRERVGGELPLLRYDEANLRVAIESDLIEQPRGSDKNVWVYCTK